MDIANAAAASRGREVTTEEIRTRIQVQLGLRPLDVLRLHPCAFDDLEVDHSLHSGLETCPMMAV